MTRQLSYYRLRVLRLSASPRAVATGVCAGVFASWLPFLGFHVLIAVSTAFLLRGNLVAAALGTAFANPLTLPAIWAATWEIGHQMLGRDGTATVSIEDVFHLHDPWRIAELWGPVLKPMTIGAIPPALISVLVIYPLTYFAVRSFQVRRRPGAMPPPQAGLTSGGGTSPGADGML
ncbi:DUF2062 domain-containing protein [Rhizobiaceae bacterium n13]|uniref:DUF2062 domain-containing protein n=1 Tax=Ferirhizobium litorale TaxID=2927786 RepID=A0AAE3QDH0_9HYPH|nr:DUF2062 domain-containing protein [Fererhizobium litorale]MDI7861141.1 DUF2062 domain-containing protein [Fererhizobium litorale]MDI7921288.1 DUF2062 domain-containing protein [Fererhizobium litorale]